MRKFTEEVGGIIIVKRLILMVFIIVGVFMIRGIIVFMRLRMEWFGFFLGVSIIFLELFV